LKNNVKTRLPGHWRPNMKPWVTAALSEEWFNSYFVRDVKGYCKKKNILLKILLLTDNALGHP
jgi:hypothetical protein